MEQSVLGVPVSVVIPRSQEVPVAGNRGESLMTAKKRGPAAKALASLTERLAPAEVPVEIFEPKPGKASKRGKRRGEKL